MLKPNNSTSIYNGITLLSHTDYNAILYKNPTSAFVGFVGCTDGIIMIELNGKFYRYDAIKPVDTKKVVFDMLTAKSVGAYYNAIIKRGGSFECYGIVSENEVLENADIDILE